MSYIDHDVLDGAVVLSAFDDPDDEVALSLPTKAHPGRTVELVDARDVFAFGAGIHCITQQQPAPAFEHLVAQRDAFTVARLHLAAAVEASRPRRTVPSRTPPLSG